MKKQLTEMSRQELWQLLPIILTEHKEYWAQWFVEEETLLRHTLPMNNITRISHIGSTAIPGIWAKPIIDILVESKKGRSLSDMKQYILQTGYICMAETENRISFNKDYTLQGFADRVFHLHLHYEGDNDELYFRDYLNKHPKIAKEYESLKVKLWKLYEHDRDTYTEHKTEFIKLCTSHAKEQMSI